MNKKFTKAMFAGSFDPITNGHLDICLLYTSRCV